ncbi:MAG: DUF3592 domain-containing protein [Magnetococcales bacterium]|nr:DUF3592 domain-containing protein [Magnetococcales bacterium]NGZ26056.1 DUF3592 domain-containing protein [Magnetococcales bacterium]
MILGFYPFHQSLKSSDWPYVEGSIITSRPNADGNKGERFSLLHRTGIEYDFQVNGRHYRGNQIEFGLGDQLFLIQTFAMRIQHRYPEDKLVRIYFNPERPEESVLEKTPSLGGSVIWIVLGIACLGFGCSRSRN